MLRHYSQRARASVPTCFADTDIATAVSRCRRDRRDRRASNDDRRGSNQDHRHVNKAEVRLCLPPRNLAQMLRCPRTHAAAPTTCTERCRACRRRIASIPRGGRHRVEMGRQATRRLRCGGVGGTHLRSRRPRNVPSERDRDRLRQRRRQRRRQQRKGAGSQTRAKAEIGAPPFGHCSAVATVAPQCLLQHSKAAARLTIPLLLLSVVAEATGRSWMLCLTPTPMAKHTTSKRMIYEPLTYHLLTFTTANTISPPPCDRNCAHSSWCRLVSTHRLAQRPYRHWSHIVPS